jgi:hypothetical protein
VKGRKAGQGLTALTVLHVHRTLSRPLLMRWGMECCSRTPLSKLSRQGHQGERLRS